MLDHFASEGVTEILCLGDIVGYNADPLPCVEAARGFAHALRGNHDRYVAGEDDERVKEDARTAVAWTRQNLPAGDTAFLKDLPDEKILDDRFLLVHGSPRDRDEYILSAESIAANLKMLRSKYLGIDICFFGHTHIPMIVGDGKVLMNFRETTVIPLKRLTPYLVNCGAVGQPRDRCPMAAAGIFDASRWELTLVRVPYPVEAMQATNRAAAMPERFSLRLEAGT